MNGNVNGLYGGITDQSLSGIDNGTGYGMANGIYTDVQNKQIVRDGLVLYLDATNRQSYVGSGTIWRDATLNGINGVLTNGPTFNNFNGGSIVFDGFNDYVEFGDILDLGLNSLTINVWTYLNNNSTSQTFLSKSLFGGQNFRYSVNTNFSAPFDRLSTFFQGNGGSDITPYGSTSLPINTWFMATFVFDRSSNIRIYYNGVRETLTNNATISQWNNLDFQSVNPFRVGIYSASNVAPLNGRLSSVIVYFRTLDDGEITRIYQTTKSKFNL
jgi:hypothetical protein